MNINFLTIHHSVPLIGYPKECAKLVGISERTCTDVLRRFKTFVKKRPNYFKALTSRPVLDVAGAREQYDLICFLHYYRFRDLLDLGHRNLKFENELEGTLKQFSIASQRLVKEEKEAV